MAHGPSALFERLLIPALTKMRGLAPPAPSVPAPELKFTVAPALRLKLAKVRSPVAYWPVALPFAAAVSALAPSAAVKAPRTSEEKVLARPVKMMLPPRRLIGAKS